MKRCNSIGYRQRRSKRGAVLVEFVFVVILLMLLVFGIIEVSLIMKDQLTVAQAAREAVRSVAVGSQPSVATQRAINTATGITLTSSNILLQKSVDNGVSWTTLQTISGTPMTSDALTGNLVRATVTYNHPLITGFVMGKGTKTLTSKVVMQRE